MLRLDLKTGPYNCGRQFGRNYNLKAILGLDYILIFKNVPS